MINIIRTTLKIWKVIEKFKVVFDGNLILQFLGLRLNMHSVKSKQGEIINPKNFLKTFISKNCNMIVIKTILVTFQDIKRKYKEKNINSTHNYY